MARPGRLFVIKTTGEVFGAVYETNSREIEPVFRHTGAAIGFNPEDKFMVYQQGAFRPGELKRLIVTKITGEVFGADIVGTNIEPVFRFTGAAIGFNPEDKFMGVIGNTLLVFKSTSEVFGAEADVRPKHWTCVSGCRGSNRFQPGRQIYG